MVYFVEAHLPNRKDVLDRVLMYVIRTLDQVADQEYTLVYVSRLSSPEYMPDVKWFRQAYALFDRRFKKNLKQIFIVHPSFWVKTTLVMCRPFLSAKLYEKIHYVDKLVDVRGV
jgi:prune family protein 2